jgi:hypothetical protein
MANFARLKRTASGVSTGDPAIGELVLNTASGYLYTTRDDGALVLINNGIPGPTGPSGALGPSGASVVGPSGAVGPTGPVGPSGVGAARYYGSFFDTTVQLNSSPSTALPVYLNTTDVSNGVSVVSGYLIKVSNSGVYDLQFSLQLDKTSANKENVDIWFAKNGSNISWSNTRIVVEGSSEKAVAAWNTFISLDANDTAEIRWCSSDSNVRLVAASGLTSPTRPDIPSVIVTVNNVS